MYKSFAIANGMLISLMILSNGLMMEYFTNTPSVLLNHIIGLTLIGFIVLITKEKWVPIKGIPLFYLLGGIIGIGTVYFTNISFMLLGATLTLMISMVSRIISSTIIDHYGLMGMKRYPFHPLKLIGLCIMILGLLLIIMS